MNRIDKYSVKSEDKEINDTRNHRHSKKKQQGEKMHFDSILTDRTKDNKTNNSEEVLYFQLLIPPKRFDTFSP